MHMLPQVVYGLLKESVNALMILYKNANAKVLSSDGDTDLIDVIF